MARTDTASTSPETWVDAVRVETGDPSATIAPGKDVTVTMQVGAVPPNTSIEVLWLGPDGRIVARDSAVPALGRELLSLTARATDEWTPGEYRAQVRIDGRPVREQRFRVAASEK